MLKLRVERMVVGRGRERVAGPLDFSLSCGDALVVTGPNGAGKSTLLRTLAGLLPPLSGCARVDGCVAPDGEPAHSPSQICHYVGHRNPMKATVSVRANLAFWQSYMGSGCKTPRVFSIDDALEQVGLPDLGDLPFGYLSAGQQRRVTLARLLVVHRQLWVLDEPTSALDAVAERRFADVMNAHLRNGGAIIAATHQPLNLTSAHDLVLEPLAYMQTSTNDTGEPALNDDLAAAEGWL